MGRCPLPDQRSCSPFWRTARSAADDCCATYSICHMWLLAVGSSACCFFAGCVDGRPALMGHVASCGAACMHDSCGRRWLRPTTGDALAYVVAAKFGALASLGSWRTRSSSFLGLRSCKQTRAFYACVPAHPPAYVTTPRKVRSWRCCCSSALETVGCMRPWDSLNQSQG